MGLLAIAGLRSDCDLHYPSPHSMLTERRTPLGVVPRQALRAISSDTDILPQGTLDL